MTNGEAVAFRYTISSATGNNENLEFDNIQTTSTIVPEPSTPALADVDGLTTLVPFQRRHS
jgi:hypothetical protein